MIAVLRQRDFSLLWFGGLLSVVGDYLLFIALPFFIYDLTGSALATGLMFMAQTLPRLLFGSVAGVFVDRWDRKRTMVVADLSRAVILLPLLMVELGDWLWLIYVVAFAEATVSMFFIPAKNSIIPSLVEERHLVPANSLNAMSEDIPSLAGALLGGALLGVVGVGGLVLLDIVTYLISAAMISRIAFEPSAAAEEPPPTADTDSATSALADVWREWTGGLRAARTERGVSVIFAVIAVAMVAEGIITVLIVAFVEGVLGGGAPEFSWLIAGLGLGGIIGSFLVGWLGGIISPTRLLALALLANGGILLLMFGFPTLPLALALSLPAGMSVVGWFVGSQTILQSWVPDRYLGRVFGAFETTQALLLLAGMGLAVTLGDLLGTVPMLLLAACLTLLAGVLAWVRLPKDRK